LTHNPAIAWEPLIPAIRAPPSDTDAIFGISQYLKTALSYSRQRNELPEAPRLSQEYNPQADFMRRLLSTYPFISRKVTPELLGQIADAGFEGVELFCSRSHFDYTSRTEIHAMAEALNTNHLSLESLHAPNNRDLSATREGGLPLSICEVERVRRIEAMDELKRAIDVAEDLPYARMILHMGGSRETADPRKRDAAFSTLEHLVLHAHHCGVTLCIENTPSEMGDPAYLRAFVDETRLTGLRFNFDTGHAHLCDGAEEERVEKCFEPLRDLVASVHLHDNHGEKDEHLPPYAGTIDWSATVKMLKTAPDGAKLPIMLELKEKTGPDAIGTLELLESARAAMDKFEEEWS
jgi:sugar phosphate isomerase/epimerase